MRRDFFLFRKIFFDEIDEAIRRLLRHVELSLHLPFVAVGAGEVAVQVEDDHDAQPRILRVQRIEETEDVPLFLLPVTDQYAELRQQGLIGRGKPAFFFHGPICLFFDEDLGDLPGGEEKQMAGALFAGVYLEVAGKLHDVRKWC